MRGRPTPRQSWCRRGSASRTYFNDGTPPGPGDTIGYTSIFAGGERGGYYNFYDPATMFQLSDGTGTVTTATDPVGYVTDQSGNGLHLTQATTTHRPTYDTTGTASVMHDGVDDTFDFTVPAGGINGTMIIMTKAGGSVQNVNYPAGTTTVLPAGADVQKAGLIGILLIDRVLTAQEVDFVKDDFTSAGAIFPLASSESGSLWFDGWLNLTELKEIDLSGAVGKCSYLCRNCDNLTEVSSDITMNAELYRPNYLSASVCEYSGSVTLSTAGIKMEGGSGWTYTGPSWTWAASSSSLRMSECQSPMTVFGNDWGVIGDAYYMARYGNAGWTSYPVGALANVGTGCRFNRAFDSTAFDSTSVDNLLIDLNTAGLTNEIIDVAGSNAARTSASDAAVTALEGRGCTVNTN